MHWEVHYLHPQSGYMVFLDMLCQANTYLWQVLAALAFGVTADKHRQIDR